jgi:hypothetical protein
MEIIVGIVLIIFVLAAVVLLVVVNRKKATEDKANEVTATPASDCCGAHEICEFDELKMDDTKIIYYDDEELDAYKNIPENEYTDKHIDEFREVLYTLKNEEIRYWLLSIERRKISLPSLLQEEARMLIAEA